MAYWWCLIHSRVEGEEGCAHKDRLGPYQSPQEAERALRRAAERTEEWDREDREWDQR